MKRTTKLRELMSTGKTVVIPGCYNAVSGKILDRVGFPAIYMTGYGTSLSLTGMPEASIWKTCASTSLWSTISLPTTATICSSFCSSGSVWATRQAGTMPQTRRREKRVMGCRSGDCGQARLLEPRHGPAC